MMYPLDKAADVDLAVMFGDLDACLSSARSTNRTHLAYLIEMAVVAAALELTETRLEDAHPLTLIEDARRKKRGALSGRLS
ncbi:MAG: hypothetical protein ACN6I5_01395 [Hyphomicrobiales bacterium]